jgi:hypothetical protein
LRLLARRFSGNEKEAFENIIEEVAKFYRFKAVNKYLSSGTLGSIFPLIRWTGIRIYASASKIFDHLYQVIIEHFATEVPELLNACPSCHGLDISMAMRATSYVTYSCNLCGHNWTDREFSAEQAV